MRDTVDDSPHRLTVVGGSAPLKARVRPHGRAGDTRPLLAIHGISRQAREIDAHFAGPARVAGRDLLVPFFDARGWPRFQRIDRRVRPDLALLGLLEAAQAQLGLRTERVDLFGYSGGAQLAHRFAMLYPERVGALHLGAAGWYTLPDPALPYPVGLGAARGAGAEWGPRMQSGLSAYLDRPITLDVGAADTDPADPALRRNPRLDAAQGTTRRARAERYAEAVAAAQRAHGLPVTVGLTVRAGCGHDFAACAAAGMARDALAST